MNSSHVSLRNRPLPLVGLRHPDFTDAPNDENATDDLQEKSVARAFNDPDPGEAGTDGNPQQPLAARFDGPEE